MMRQGLALALQGGIVRVEMAGQARRVSFQEHLRMRLLVAFRAERHRLVPVLMAGRAGYGGMPAGRIPQRVDNVEVARGAGHVPGIAAVGHQRRLVNRVAAGAGIKSLFGVMGLVAHVATRFEAVRGVTGVAGQPGVFAGVVTQFGLRLGMAFATAAGQPRAHDRLLDGMGIVVTVGAVGDRLAVRQFVTAVTAGHEGQIRLDPFGRVIGVECLVACLALEAVLAAGVFQFVEMSLMALATLRRCQRLRLAGIEFRLEGDLHCGAFPGDCRAEKEQCRQSRERADREHSPEVSFHGISLQGRFF